MDRRVTLQRETRAADANGEMIGTWAPLAVVWAQVMPTSGREADRSAGEARAAIADARMRIRWSVLVSDLSPLDRVLHDGRLHDVLAVREIGRREGIEADLRARAE